MAKRQIIESTAPWEPIVGYSRAVRVGPFIAVTGTTALNDKGELIGDGDLILQTRQCLRNIAESLRLLGASVEDVTRTRIFMTNIQDWELVGKIHGQVFKAIRPATTMVEVSNFIDPRILVEIEADAIVARDLPDSQVYQPSSGSSIPAALVSSPSLPPTKT
jgi:enamine deaminase RidA (YjgF/YER057c/UK114 family)